MSAQRASSNRNATPELSAPDQLGDIPLPQAHPVLLGHDQALDDFCKQYKSGKLHHAFLLTGPRGIGKASFAYRLAWHVLSNTNCATAPDRYIGPQEGDEEFSRIAKGGHGNLLTLAKPWNHASKRYSTQVTVDEVRRTVPFFGTTSAENAMRICIVDAADDLNPNAANALLKVLEEPPANCCFFLISHSPGKLLPTIRSRCQTIRLKPLQDDEVLAILKDFGVLQAEKSEEKLAMTATLAQGSVRRAIMLLENEGLELYQSLCALGFDAIEPDWPQIHKLAGQLALRANEEKYLLFVDLVLEEIARRVHLITSQDTGGGNLTSKLAHLPEVWEKVEQITTTSDEYNLDRKQVILSIFNLLAN